MSVFVMVSFSPTMLPVAVRYVCTGTLKAIETNKAMIQHLALFLMQTFASCNLTRFRSHFNNESGFVATYNMV